jgi:hypothetical protein
MQKFLLLAVILALVFTACEQDEDIDDENVNTGSDAATTLRIKNESSVTIKDVVWNNVTFTDDQNTIKTGTNITKNVESGSGYIYFKREGNLIVVRTNTLIVANENTANEFVFTNNVLITEVANVGNTATLGTFYTGTYVGDIGPGGGTVFYAEGGQYKECSGELGIYSWADAGTTASNYRGGGFTDWGLPDRGELDLMYQNLHTKGLGGFMDSFYWSSTTVRAQSSTPQNYRDMYYAQNFSSSALDYRYDAWIWDSGFWGSIPSSASAGKQVSIGSDPSSCRVRAVRSFNQ